MLAAELRETVLHLLSVRLCLLGLGMQIQVFPCFFFKGHAAIASMSNALCLPQPYGRQFSPATHLLQS